LVAARSGQGASIDVAQGAMTELHSL
jgi:hypothetical protein